MSWTLKDSEVKYASATHRKCLTVHNKINYREGYLFSFLLNKEK